MRTLLLAAMAFLTTTVFAPQKSRVKVSLRGWLASRGGPQGFAFRAGGCS